jgi:hypothetical protein
MHGRNNKQIQHKIEIYKKYQTDICHEQICHAIQKKQFKKVTRQQEIRRGLGMIVYFKASPRVVVPAPSMSQ